MYNFITQEPVMRKLVHTLSRYEVLASSVYAAVHLGIPEILNANQPLSIQALHEALLVQKKITNKDAGPLTRLLKFLSCYGIFNVAQNQVRHTTLSETLLQPNITQSFSGLSDVEWRKQADFMNYLAKLPTALPMTSAKISLDEKTRALCISTETAADLMTEIANIQLLSRAIYSAARLGLMDLINQNVNTVAALASATQQDLTALTKLVHLLARFKLLDITRDDTLALTPASVPLMEGSHEFSIKAAAGMANNHWWNSIGYLRHCVETGNVPYIAVNQISVFDYLETLTDERVRFDRGLANSDAEQDRTVAEANFEINSDMRIVDIGGGNGGLITGLVKTHRPKEATLFDQPKTIEHLHEKIITAQKSSPIDEHSALLSQCVLQPGNFLVAPEETGIPRHKDLYIIKGVLHDFTDDDVVTILKNLAHAMSNKSVLKIVERYLIDDNQPDHNKIGDMQMMAFFAAKERSLEDYQRLAKKAGLTLDLSSSQRCGNYTIISAKLGLLYTLEPAKFGESKAIMLASTNKKPSDVESSSENSLTPHQTLPQIVLS